ncbi:MAG: 16S rRNA (cytosine(1402)-N(4))-methyltransferase RsmH [Bacteroidales bacterium]
MGQYHIPVLLEESIEGLKLKDGGLYADVTFGGGGHSRAILSKMGENSTLISMDRDSDVLDKVPRDKRLIFVHNNYRFLRNYTKYHGFEKIDGVIADLGVSSHQFDREERGFSFRFDSLLDMRMNRLGNKSAADIIKSYSEERLASLFYLYGEIDRSRELAALICRAREGGAIERTFELNEAVAPLLPKFKREKFLAKIYQALRIEVNGELNSLELFLDSVTSLMREGGRLVVITYHSLEDRIVKNYMRSGNIEGRVTKDFLGNRLVPYRVVTRKPIVPSPQEIEKNSRARSAKLRIAERCSATIEKSVEL